MNNLKIFENQEFGQVRVIDQDGKPYFVLKDVCEVLEIGNSRMVADRLDDDEKGVSQIDTLGGKQEMTTVNESGLYSVILRSDKPQAKPFKKWVTAEVLPAIRKTGGYVGNDELFINTYLPFADETTKTLFRGTLEIVKKQNESIQIMQPKADYFDALVERNLLTSIRDTAKELRVKEGKFIEWLLKKYCYRDGKGKIKPRADYTPSLFELKEFQRNGHTDNQTLITPKGRETFRLLMIKDGLIDDRQGQIAN